MKYGIKDIFYYDEEKNEFPELSNKDISLRDYCLLRPAVIMFVSQILNKDISAVEVKSIVEKANKVISGRFDKYKFEAWE